MKPRFRLTAILLAILPSACAPGGGPEASPSPEVPPPAAAAPAPEPPPELEAGARVVDIRVARDPVILTTGEAVELQDLQPTPVDVDGLPVPGVPLITTPLQGRVATLEQGVITGREEGEVRLFLAVMVPGPGGQPEPRMFPVSVVVRGEPVASLRIVAPEETVHTGTAVPFSVEPRTADGRLRTQFESQWTSRNPEIASVTSAGFVRGHRSGRATVVASVEGVDAAHVVEVVDNPVRSITLTPDNASVRTGDVVRFEAMPRDADGEPVPGIAVTYSVGGDGLRSPVRASVYEDGAFVASSPGSYRVVASVGGVSSSSVVEARARAVEREAVRVGLGMVPNAPASDLWVFRGGDGRDYAYVGTHEGGGMLLAWDVTDPANPVRTDSVAVDAHVVNDVKVNDAATLAVITREGESDRRDGIVLLDLTDPAHPEVIASSTETLAGGVHNTFIEGDLVYAVHNGTHDVHILDISDPTRPREVGRWGIDAPGKYLNDFWIVDGIGYASYWDDGVWILDVGDGRWGGTPTEPVVVSSYAYPEGATHGAFPYRNSDGHSYLFTGDEILGCEECVSRAGTHAQGPRGFIHILSMEDPENPVEVGRYRVPEAGAHNIWIEDDLLYVAYYQGGLRVVDVSGELRGDLYEQGREVAWFPTGHPEGTPANSPMAWGPQPYQGNIFVSDMHSGLWVVRLEPPRPAPR